MQPSSHRFLYHNHSGSKICPAFLCNSSSLRNRCYIDRCAGRLPCLRLRGLYLAMATMAFASSSNMFSSNGRVNPRALGMAAPAITLLGFNIDSDRKFYFLIAIIVFLLGFAAKNLMRMKIGRAFVAIRDRDIAADVIGVNLTRYKVMAFGISSFLCGNCRKPFCLYTQPTSIRSTLPFSFPWSTLR